MKLIEQLGGYEQAKAKYDSRPFDLAWSDIGDALLEYRRAHGIFEIEDAIVWCDTEDNKIYTVFDVDGNDLLFEVFDPITGVTTYTGCPVEIEDHRPIRHATDEEIKAVRRLPQLETLRDCDIPPNVIILGDK